MPAINKSTLKNKTNPSEVTVVPSQIKELLVWKAPTRPFKKRNKEYFSTIAAIVFLLAVILLFIKEWLLIAVIIAMMFLVYVLATVPPKEVINKITNRGVVIAGKTYKWGMLERFWFTKKWDCEILNFETRLVFPRQFQLVLKGKNKEDIKKVIEKYILFEKPKKTLMDNAAKWLQEKVPLET